MNKRKTARIFNDLSMAFFLISSTVVAFLPIADREKHPAIAVLAGGIFWVGLLWGIFLYILSCQKIRNLKNNIIEDGLTVESCASDNYNVTSVSYTHLTLPTTSRV